MKLHTTIGIERDEYPDEIIVDVYGEFIPGEKGYFSDEDGGYPGSDPDVEFIRAEYQDKEITLTEREQEQAHEALLEELENV